MNKEDIENQMYKILTQIDSFKDEPTYEKAVDIDMNITILRFMIGEQNFLPLHFFRTAHEDAIKFIDEHKKQDSSSTKD